jgi:hypothetical protein
MEVLSRAPYHVDFLVYKDELPDPSSACLEPSWGSPGAAEGLEGHPT